MHFKQPFHILVSPIVFFPSFICQTRYFLGQVFYDQPFNLTQVFLVQLTREQLKNFQLLIIKRKFLCGFH